MSTGNVYIPEFAPRESPDDGWTPPAWPRALLIASGPVAMATAVAMLCPLALAATDTVWTAVVLLAGAGLFWWTTMWVRGDVPPPPARVLGPLLLLGAVCVARPLVMSGLAFFRTLPELPANASASQVLLALDRESALLAMQKLLMALLLAVPLWHAAGIRSAGRLLFRLALLAAIAGLLMITAIGGAGGLLDEPVHVLALLAACGCWLFGAARGSLRLWRRLRPQAPGHPGPQPSNAHLLAAALAALLLAATAAIGLSLAFFRFGWPTAVPWVALACGLTVVVNARKPAIRWLGIALLAEAVVAVAAAWPRGLAARAFDRGGLTGWSAWQPPDPDQCGLLWLVQWRGVAGLAVAVAAIAWVVAHQVRAQRRIHRRELRWECGGAMAASWMIGLGWLIGPGRIGGGAALLGLVLWAMSLGPVRCGPDRRRGWRFLLFLMLLVLFCYGLLGLTMMAHPVLWLSVPARGGDKLLHATWGLYVTLACCLSLTLWGRWPAALLGLAGSVGLAAAAEYIQLDYLPNRQFDWMDVTWYAAAGALVALALLIVPFRARPPRAIKCELRSAH
ncbi:MAG: hypothetical protein BIFFINMI_01297 [Phycisphaerae bacterium]|nr:hypothetical protein [Phycisphaerae bacterium]